VSPFADRVRERLDELGLTAIGAATRKGYARDLIRNVVRSDTRPRYDTLIKIADALDTTPEALLGPQVLTESQPRREKRGGVSMAGGHEGRVTLNLQANVSMGVAAQILALIEGDGPV
jgi:transcriptional regulator with XRE-family HTH domain